MGLLYGGSMRTIRQFLFGCKKHHYVYYRDVKWFEDAHSLGGFKTKLVCKNCMHVEYSKVDMMICRSKLDYIRYGKLKQNESSEQAQKAITDMSRKKWTYAVDWRTTS